jgi:NTP pyrophosphatase (non-canonical NTP hydrolase)
LVCLQRVRAASPSARASRTTCSAATFFAGEAGELAAILQWYAPSEDVSPYMPSLEEEIADVLIYLTRLADVLGIDLIAAGNTKIDRNAERFPANRDQPSL